jgi:hypothetical protein
LLLHTILNTLNVILHGKLLNRNCLLIELMQTIYFFIEKINF